MQQELQVTKKEKRALEFAKAKVEALASARGHSLMRCQQAVKAAEEQQVQLSEVLRLALDKLGLGVKTPDSACMSQDYKHTAEAAPADHRGTAADCQRQEAVAVEHPAAQLFMSPPPQHSVAQQRPASAESASRQSPSGFTVYSNELSDTPLAQPTADAEEECASATKWRDISEVVAQSPASAVATPPTIGEQQAAVAVAVEEHARRLAQMIIPQLETTQLESLVNIGASMASPSYLPQDVRQKMLQTLASSQELNIVEAPKDVQQAVAPVETVAAPARTLPSEPAGWTSPRQNLPTLHVDAVLQDTDGDFYAPFGSSAPRSQPPQRPVSLPAPTTSSIEAMPPPPPKPRAQLAAAAAPKPQEVRNQQASREPRRSTFSMADATQHASISLRSPRDGVSDSGLIKAVGVSRETLAHAAPAKTAEAVAQRVSGIPEDDRFARQRRAAERLVQKLNSKLPPEYRRADPAAFGLGVTGGATVQAKVSVATPTADRVATPGSGGSSGGRKAPKGSLRLRAEAQANR